MDKKSCTKKFQEWLTQTYEGEPSQEEWESIMEEDRSHCYNHSQEIIVTSDDDPVLSDEDVIQEEVQVPSFK